MFLLVVLQGSLCDTSLELDPPSILIRHYRRSLAGINALLRLKLLVLLAAPELVHILHAFNQLCPVNTVAPWRNTERSRHFCIGLRLNDFASLSSRDKIDWIILKFVLSWHLGVFYFGLLRTGLRFFDFLHALLGLDWWVVDCRLLLVGAVHAVKHFTNLVMPAKVFI